MLRTIIIALLALLTVAAIVTHTDEAYQAALQGLSIWWNIVFPGLLPFLILAELLLAFGAVHAIGALLDPLMRRLFGLPGEAGWAWALGWIAGSPAGAAAAAELRAGERLTAAEGQRLLALSYMPSPIVLLVVVGAGFLHDPRSGLIIAFSLWASALLLGMAMNAFATAPTRGEHSLQLPQGSRNPAWQQLPAAMLAQRQRDGRNLGKVLGDAVNASVQKLMAIGGIIIISALLARLVALALPAELPALALSGLFESHLGAYSLAQSPPAGTASSWQYPAIAGLLACGGLSSFLQVQALIARSGLRMLPFALARLAHGGLAFLFAWLLWKPASALLAAAIPAFGASPAANAPASGFTWPQMLHYVPQLLLLLALMLMASIVASRLFAAAARWRRS